MKPNDKGHFLTKEESTKRTLAIRHLRSMYVTASYMLPYNTERVQYIIDESLRDLGAEPESTRRRRHVMSAFDISKKGEDEIAHNYYVDWCESQSHESIRKVLQLA